MEKSFTQRMDWLHTWFGLVLGWLAFALFLTGTLAVFWFEIQHWAQPELHGTKMLSPEATVQYSVDYLQKVAPDSRRWAVTLPDLERHPLLVLNWLDENNAQQFARLVPDGSGRKVTTVTNGGRFFVDFHWTFNREVPDLQGRTFRWTYMLSGFVGMAFLICMITGLVVHKKIFRNFFTFRHDAKSPQTRWLDAHNVLGVISWPFQFMIVLSGLVFYCYLYIPTGMQMAARYPAPARVAAVGGGGPGMLWGRFASDAVGSVPGNIVEPGNPAPNVPIVESLRAGAGADGHSVQLHGQQSQPRQRDGEIRWHAGAPERDHLHVRQHDVRWRHRPHHQSPWEHRQRGAEADQHLWRHALRVLRRHRDAAPVFSVRRGRHDHDRDCGLVMFTTKRRAQTHSAAAGRFYAFVDRMNVASIGGSLFACASYFWALRLLPQSLSDPSGGFSGGVYASIRAVPLDQAMRSDLELYMFWLAWGVAGVHALARAPHKAWTEQFAAVAALCIGLPAIGYLVPNCDIGSMIAAGDWKVVAVDLGGMSIGLMLAWAAWKMSSQRVDVRVGKVVGAPVLSPAK